MRDKSFVISKNKYCKPEVLQGLSLPPPVENYFFILKAFLKMFIYLNINVNKTDMQYKNKKT